MLWDTHGFEFTGPLHPNKDFMMEGIVQKDGVGFKAVLEMADEGV